MDGKYSSGCQELSTRVVGVEESRCPQDSTNPYVQQRKAAKRYLRKKQRKEAASLRKQKVEQIMEAEGDSRTFFKLVGQQRKTASQQTGILRVDGRTCDTDQDICAGWASLFQNLATPLQNKKFDADYKDFVDDDIECIVTICKVENRDIECIKIEEVKLALRKLKKQ